MAHQALTETALPDRGGATSITVPEVAVRIAGALLALAVAAVHVADQGSVGELVSPSWIGWGYRAVEVGGVLTALVLLLPVAARFVPAWAGWAAAVLLGAGPFIAYILSRSVGVPGDSGDVGNWGYWVGTVALFIEAGLIALAVAMLAAMSRSAGGGLLSLIRR